MNNEYKDNELYQAEEKFDNFVAKYGPWITGALLTTAYFLAYIAHFK